MEVKEMIFQELRDAGYTTLGDRRLRELIAAKLLEARKRGKQWFVAIHDDNLKAMQRYERGESRTRKN